MADELTYEPEAAPDVDDDPLARSPKRRGPKKPKPEPEPLPVPGPDPEPEPEPVPDGEPVLQQAKTVKRAARKAMTALKKAGPTQPSLLVRTTETFSVTTTALQFHKPLGFKEWEQIGVDLGTGEKAINFWIGDWVNYGDATFGEKSSQAIDVTGFKYETIQQYARIAAKIAPERRVSDLSWSHHREVADLTPDDQTFWLERACIGDAGVPWAPNRLRAEIKEQQAREKGEKAASGFGLVSEEFVVTGRTAEALQAVADGAMLRLVFCRFDDLAERDALLERLNGAGLKGYYSENYRGKKLTELLFGGSGDVVETPVPQA
jgi:hypothetical protein